MSFDGEQIQITEVFREVIAFSASDSGTPQPLAFLSPRGKGNAFNELLKKLGLTHLN